MQFKVGDTVQLKSGGPVMTIDSAIGSGEYWCVWFPSNSSEPKGSAFKAEMLTAA